jgi:hypothetical protein
MTAWTTPTCLTSLLFDNNTDLRITRPQSITNLYALSKPRHDRGKEGAQRIRRFLYAAITGISRDTGLICGPASIL